MVPEKGSERKGGTSKFKEAHRPERMCGRIGWRRDYSRRTKKTQHTHPKKKHTQTPEHTSADKKKEDGHKNQTATNKTANKNGGTGPRKKQLEDPATTLTNERACNENSLLTDNWGRVSTGGLGVKGKCAEPTWGCGVRECESSMSGESHEKTRDHSLTH